MTSLTEPPWFETRSDADIRHVNISSPLDGLGQYRFPLYMGALGGFFNRRFSPQRYDQRLMSGRAQELDQIGAREAGRAGVDQRVKIEPLWRIIAASSTTGTLPPLVDRAERRHRARPHAPDLFQKIGRAERNAPLRADFLVHPLEVDAPSRPAPEGTAGSSCP